METKSKSPPTSPGKSPLLSAVTMTELVLPSDTNALGSIFGGKVMSWIDIAAAISASRHSRRVVVTASIDALHFIAPIKLGHFVHIRAMVNFAGRTSTTSSPASEKSFFKAPDEKPRVSSSATESMGRFRIIRINRLIGHNSGYTTV